MTPPALQEDERPRALGGSGSLADTKSSGAGYIYIERVYAETIRSGTEHLMDPTPSARATDFYPSTFPRRVETHECQSISNAFHRRPPLPPSACHHEAMGSFSHSFAPYHRQYRHGR